MNDLTEVLQDTIRTRVKIKRPVPQSRWWWNSDLDDMRKEINRLSSISYCYRARDDHPSHRELRRLHNKYGTAIIQAKWKHWTDYLEGTTADDISTANRYVKNPAGDGGNPRIPTLKVAGTDGIISEVNMNDGKANAFLDAFFPNPPLNSSMPADYNYLELLPDPPPLSCKQIGMHI